MIYLDNGATSFPKPRGMTAEMEDCIVNYCGNPGRSGHYMSMKTGEAVYQARKDTARLFGIKDPARLIFTKNTTESLNMAMSGFLQEGDHVVTTSMEHNSVYRPLKRLEESGVSHTIVKGDRMGRVSAQAVENALTESTSLIVITGASNVSGTIMPFDEIGKIAEQHHIPLLLDGAQCAGSIPIDVGSMKISMLAFPGHKGLLGPLGTGGLYVAPDIQLRPLLCGGTGTQSKSRNQPCDFPEGFEAGTINAPGIIGLGYSVRFIQKVGVEAISFYERQLIRQFDEAVQNMDFIELYGPAPEEKTGISLFNIRNVESEEVTGRLSREFGIAVRGGYHCSGFAHMTVGTWDTGAVRLSVGPFNTRKEIAKAIEAVWKIGKGR
ncbi:MAG: aminotransferase class V-fold PLP-dependent enzyme [Anaerovoracaceae bacterium]